MPADADLERIAGRLWPAHTVIGSNRRAGQGFGRFRVAERDCSSGLVCSGLVCLLRRRFKQLACELKERGCGARTSYAFTSRKESRARSDRRSPALGEKPTRWI